MCTTDTREPVARVTDVAAQQRSHLRTLVWVAVAALALIAMYWHVGQVFVSRWFGDSAHYHCIAVPAIAGWFLWRRWEKVVEVEHRSSAAGIALLIVGLILYWASARTGVRMIAGLTFPIILAGIVGGVFGLRMLQIVAAPIAILVFAVPFPEHAVGMLAMPMQQISAVITGAVAPLLGLPVERHGIILNLRGFDFVVAQECSGMHSLVALLLTGFVLVELSGLEAVRRAIAIAVIAPLVLFANVIRLVVVLLLAEYFGANFALGTVVHGFSDVIVYFAAVLSFVLIIGWLYESQQKQVGAAAVAAPESAEREAS
ncbi:MAG: exosortase/archaeosortase family protein [Armatimonadota bacterium]|jgi:exosortase